jgi:hypothetical protein
MRKTVELHDLAEPVQREILDCAMNVGIPIERIMGWINEGITAAETSYDTNEMEVGGE